MKTFQEKLLEDKIADLEETMAAARDALARFEISEAYALLCQLGQIQAEHAAYTPEILCGDFIQLTMN